MCSRTRLTLFKNAKPKKPIDQGRVNLIDNYDLGDFPANYAGQGSFYGGSWID